MMFRAWCDEAAEVDCVKSHRAIAQEAALTTNANSAVRFFTLSNYQRKTSKRLL